MARSLDRHRPGPAASLMGAALLAAACSGSASDDATSSSVATTAATPTNAPPATSPPTTSPDSTPSTASTVDTAPTEPPSDPPVLDPPGVDGVDGDVDVAALRLDQPLRPSIHYSPPFGWMNDPNGLSFVDGRWHLFFQYNPTDVDFGDIGWGHAVSDDLLTWETWPVAIEPSEGELIFSGSVVIDRSGTSPLCDRDAQPSCLVAVYTTHRTRPDGTVQTQDLAVSDRAGIEFSKFDGNPVIDLAASDFRDPKVFWHPPSERWVMVVVLPLERQVVLFGSPDLVGWTELSRFGPLGAVDGIWECPDLFPVPVTEGTADAPAEKWVMKVDLNPGHVAGGSGGQYFLGEFDGTTFVPDEPDQPAPRWVDWGTDFYCATTFHEGNDELGRPLWLGWMNNWNYAGEIPTFPWRGSMTLPRRLELTTGTDGQLALTQRLPDALDGILGEPVALDELPDSLPEAFVLDVEPRDDRDGEVTISLLADGDAAVQLVLGPDDLQLVRPPGGNLGPDGFAGAMPPAPLGDGPLTVVVDRSSVEVVAAGGRTVVTSLVLPRSTWNGVAVDGDGVGVSLRPLAPTASDPG